MCVCCWGFIPLQLRPTPCGYIGRFFEFHRSMNRATGRIVLMDSLGLNQINSIAIIGPI
jgi:hypothetical protein